MKTASPAPVRVMLVDDNAGRAERVEEHLKSNGFEVISAIASAAGLLYQIEQHKPDVVLIDLQSPDRDVLESLAIVNQHNPMAMVMFTEEDDPAYIQKAFAAGVSTYLMEGINPARVKPVIEVAMAQFRAFQSLREELNNVRLQLEDRTAIEQAKGLLMLQKRIGESDAHRMLTQLAMSNNLRLRDVAHTVIATLSPLEIPK